MILINFWQFRIPWIKPLNLLPQEFQEMSMSIIPFEDHLFSYFLTYNRPFPVQGKSYSALCSSGSLNPADTTILSCFMSCDFLLPSLQRSSSFSILFGDLSSYHLWPSSEEHSQSEPPLLPLLFSLLHRFSFFLFLARFQ